MTFRNLLISSQRKDLLMFPQFVIGIWLGNVRLDTQMRLFTLDATQEIYIPPDRRETSLQMHIHSFSLGDGGDIDSFKLEMK